MSVNERGQSSTPAVKDEARPTNSVDRPFDFSTPFFDSRTACAYVCCRSVKAFYMWCKRHGITRRSNGSIAKVELDRELRRKRKTRVMSAVSLANLRTRRKAR